MKIVLFAAALAASLPAFAQDTTPPNPPPADMSAPPAAPNNGAMTPPAPDSTMPATPDSTMPSTTTTTGSMTTQTDPGAAAAPTGMTMPAPANAGSMSTATGMANAPAAGDPSTYPVCSKTVQDRCVNRSASAKSKRRPG